MLTPIEGRVLGCLLEKESTTPDQYPLTLNALMLACNQSSSREPVMVVDVADVEAAIVTLKAAGLARVVHPSHGRSVTRYRQVADERYRWTPGQRAVITLLLLRGPQTSGELRTRSERLLEFNSVDAVERVLDELARCEAPQAALQDRAAGQKEPRWQQLIADELQQASGRPQAIAPSGSASQRIDELEARVARLETALGDLLGD